ncbi:MAG: glycine oxidase [Cellvibrionaceae bacterium]|jgi:glycine oxidase
MRRNPSIGIAGAGIMGRVLAWQLMRAGYTVSLFDKDNIEYGEAAAYTAAGMLAPYCEIESAECLVRELGMRSLGIWEQIAQSLSGDLDFFQLGSLVVAHHNDRADLHNFNRQVQQKLRPTEHQFKQLDQQQLASLEPELSERFSEASYLPEESWLCPKRTMKALADDLLSKGINWYPNRLIHEVEPHGIATNEGRHRFDWAIDCRGLGAKPQWGELRGVRGELIVLQAPEVKIKRLVRLMHPRYRLYLVPRGYDSLYIIGATQIESNDNGPITVRSSLELLSAAYSLHSGFAEARIVDIRTNCRPALKDNLPRIEYSDGLIRINGLFRHGYLLSPALGQEVTQWLQTPDYQSNFSGLMKRVA